MVCVFVFVWCQYIISANVAQWKFHGMKDVERKFHPFFRVRKIPTAAIRKIIGATLTNSHSNE